MRTKFLLVSLISVIIVLLIFASLYLKCMKSVSEDNGLVRADFRAWLEEFDPETFRRGRAGFGIYFFALDQGREEYLYLKACPFTGKIASRLGVLGVEKIELQAFHETEFPRKSYDELWQIVERCYGTGSNTVIEVDGYYCRVIKSALFDLFMIPDVRTLDGNDGMILYLHFLREDVDLMVFGVLDKTGGRLSEVYEGFRIEGVNVLE